MIFVVETQKVFASLYTYIYSIRFINKHWREYFIFRQYSSIFIILEHLNCVHLLIIRRSLQKQTISLLLDCCLMRHTNILQTMLLPIQPELRRRRVILIKYVKPFEACLLLQDLEHFILGCAREHSTLGFIIGCAMREAPLVHHPVGGTGRGAHQGMASIRLTYKGA